MDTIVQRRFLPIQQHAGYADEDLHEYALAVGDLVTVPRPLVVAGGLSVFQIPADHSGTSRLVQSDSAADTTGS